MPGPVPAFAEFDAYVALYSFTQRYLPWRNDVFSQMSWCPSDSFVHSFDGLGRACINQYFSLCEYIDRRGAHRKFHLAVRCR